MGKDRFEETILKVKQLMSEKGGPLQVVEIAEHIGVTKSSAYGILDLMEAFGVIQTVKRGKNYYFLKGAYSDEQISAMLPPKKAAKAVRVPKAIRVPKPIGRSIHPRPQPKDRRDSFRDEYLSDLRERAGSGEGLSALALLRLPQEWAAEAPTTEPKPHVEMVLALMGENKVDSPIRSRAFGTVKQLPKDYRRLTKGETSHLKNQLRGLDGYEKIERLNTAFAKFSALECGRYGNLFYFSMGTNPWDTVRKVTVDPAISDLIMLPTIEANKWTSWNNFLTGLNETRNYSKSIYDETLDKFLESGHKLVEITVENRSANYFKNMLKKKIEERGIMDQVNVSLVYKWIYLEKVE